MYAIVDIAGQQYKVEKGQKLYVHRLEGEEGSAVAFDKVLLMAGDDNSINLKNLKYSSVKATILGHLKGDKKIVFKKKRRKGYQVKNGHRQALTQIQESTLVFVPKILAIFVAMLIALPFMADALQANFMRITSHITGG